MGSGIKRSATAVVLVLLFVLFVIFITPKLLQIESLSRRSDNLEREIAQLRQQGSALETELRLLRDDPIYVEKVAREKFNKVKEGEIVYKVVREGQGRAVKVSKSDI